MLKQLRIGLILSFAFISFTCNKGIDNNHNGIDETITTSIQGSIFDLSNQPIAHALIRVGNTTTLSDNKGFFRISSISLKVTAMPITVQKEGYFKSFRTFNATKGNNYVRIQMLPRSVTGTINSANGGQILLSNNSSISISPNSLVDKATGQAYNGDVNLFAFYIDPSIPGFEERIPGSLMAGSSSGEIISLVSFGMLAIELESPAGKSLQIAPGKTAGLNFTIPSSLMANAPATIPLWYLDENNGLWKQEGTASRTSNGYQGTVSHFSYWNCDIPNSTISLDITLLDPQSSPLPYTKVRIKQNSASYSHGYTDSLGKIKGFVPPNQVLTMEVIDYCNTVIFSKSIGPFTNNTQLSPVIIQSLSGNLVKVFGKAVTCNNIPVSNGFVTLQYGNNEYRTLLDSTGGFSFNIVKCNTANTAYLTATDIQNSIQSTPAPVILSSPVTNAGNIAACGISTLEFFEYDIDATHYFFSSSTPPNTFYGLATYVGGVREHHSIAARQQNYVNDIILHFKDNYKNPGPGEYVFLYLKGYGYPVLVSPSQIYITNLPAVGGYYEGSFNTNFKDSVNQVHNVNGTFRVRRSP